MARITEGRMRRVLVGLVVAGSVSAFPVVASADVVVSGGTPIDPTLIASASGAEAEDLTITTSGGKLRFAVPSGTITDNTVPAATIANPEPCVLSNANRVLECFTSVSRTDVVGALPTLFLRVAFGTTTTGLDDRLTIDQAVVAQTIVATGAGNDTITFGAGGLRQVSGGAGFDTLILSAPATVNAAGAPVTALEMERFVGSPGNDTFGSTAIAEQIEGGGGEDIVTYASRPADQPVFVDLDGVADDGAAGEGDNISADVENLLGGAGNDTLAGAPAVANQLRGGDGIDTASYAGRTDTIIANLDDLAGDGAAAENDQLAGFEALAGGEGNDFLTGSSGTNTLSGAGGNDVLDGADGTDTLNGEGGNDQLTGGSGVDIFSGGDGDDAITSFDGLGEDVDCGAGNDGATVDVADRLVACEAIRRVDEVLDVDRDGSLPPADCNDNDATRKPGLRDIPQNGKDEDCSGSDAPFGKVRATVQHQWAFNSRLTFATKFTVRDVPSGSRIKLTCDAPKGKSQACPFKTKTRESVGGAKSIKLLSSFKKRKLPVGTVLELRITRAETIGKVLRFTTRPRKAPSVKTLCLQPGAKNPKKC